MKPADSSVRTRRAKTKSAFERLHVSAHESCRRVPCQLGSRETSCRRCCGCRPRWRGRLCRRGRAQGVLAWAQGSLTTSLAPRRRPPGWGPRTANAPRPSLGCVPAVSRNPRRSPRVRAFAVGFADSSVRGNLAHLALLSRRRTHSNLGKTGGERPDDLTTRGAPSIADHEYVGGAGFRRSVTQLVTIDSDGVTMLPRAADS